MEAVVRALRLEIVEPQRFPAARHRPGRDRWSWPRAERDGDDERTDDLVSLDARSRRLDTDNQPAAGRMFWFTRKRLLRVVLALDLRQPRVVVAVGGLHALLALVHHEVHVGAARRVGVQRLQ